MRENKFSSREEMEAYLMWSLEHSVVNWIRLSRETGRGWCQVAQGNEMVSEVHKGTRIRVEVDRVGLAIRFGTTGGSDESHVWDGTESGQSLEELLREIEKK